MNTGAEQANGSGIIANANIEINAEPALVWDALINPVKIKKYFMNTDALSDWQVGSPITFTGEWEGQKYKDKGTVLANDHHHLLQYSYLSSMGGMEDKPENYVTITYKLTSKGASTLLEISQENVPNEKMRKHSEENWNKVIAGLKELVETDPNFSTEEPLGGE